MGIPSAPEGAVSESLAAPARLAASSPERNRTAMPRVLVADDDPVALESLAFLLSEQGYEVFRASTGGEALRQLEAGDGPGLAVLDWVMPDLDGKEICQRIRACRSSRYIYMILVTAREDPAAVVEALGAGADDYIRKPFNPQELRARVDAGSRIIVQRALRESEERFHSAFESAGMGMALMDLDGHFRQVNQALCDYLGFTSEELLRRTFPTITHPDDLTMDLRALEELNSGTRKTYQAEKRYIHKQGHAVWVHVLVSAVRNADGRPAGLFSQVQDITERRHLEHQLRQAQKLEAVGQLTAGIAHEINTPAQFASDNLSFLRDSWKSVNEVLSAYRGVIADQISSGLSEQARSALHQAEQTADVDFIALEIPRAIDQALDGVQRVATIVRAMKEFSHPDSAEKTPVDINKAIATTITVARNEWKYVANVETKFDNGLALVLCRAGELNQVILNLIVNAAHAIKDKVKDGQKGLITVCTRAKGDFAEIAITDTGSGIPEAIRSRVFDPFFTTKGVGKGTGQGLALAHTSIVKNHGGKIWFESEVGRGTTFFIHLPLQFQNTTIQ